MYIYNVAKSLGFRFEAKKEKTKPKDFAACMAESKRWFAPVLFIAKPLATIMKEQYFHSTNFFGFIKSEYRNRKNTNGFVDSLISLFQLFISSLHNFQIQKLWTETFKSIEKKCVDFHPELNCRWNGQRPSIIKLALNQDVERIEFKFDKCHLLKTEDSLFFFPYNSPVSKSFYRTLEKPFRIIYDLSKKKDKYLSVNTFSYFENIEEINGKTKITFKIPDSKNNTELIVDGKITVANKA